MSETLGAQQPKEIINKVVYIDLGITTSAQDQGAALAQNYSSDYLSIVDSTKVAD
jgi:hypothetical protein